MDRTATVTRHPIRGAVYGLLLGFSAAVYLILFAVIAFGDWVPLIIVLAAGVIVGILWAYVAPAKQPKGAGDRPPGGRPVPEFGGVEEVVVGPYSAPTAAPAAAAPTAPMPPAAPEPPAPDAPTDWAAPDDSGEFDADV